MSPTTIQINDNDDQEMEKLNQSSMNKICEKSKENLNETIPANNQNNPNDNQNDLNTTTKRLIPTELSLNLGWSLRSDVIGHFINFSLLLTGRSIKSDDKKKLTKTNNDLIQRLSILSFGDSNESELRLNLQSIDVNLLEDLNKNEDELFFELSWNMRFNIVNLLIKNFNFIVLFNDSIHEEDKKMLIEENNNLVRLLLDLSVKIFDHSKLTGNQVEGDKSEDNRSRKKRKFDDQISNLIEKTSKFEENFEKIDELKIKVEKISELEDKINEVSAKNNEVKFTFKIKDLKNFLRFKKTICSDYFYCHHQWYLELRSNNESNGKKFIGIYLFLKTETCDLTIELDYLEFKILHQTNDLLHRCLRRSSNNKKLFVDKKGIGFSNFISHDDLIGYIKEDCIKINCRFRVKVDSEI